MNKPKNEDTIKNLDEVDVEKVSGGRVEGGKIYTGPTPSFDHPIATAYGMPSPIVHHVLMEYGGPMPKKPEIVPHSSEDTDKETKK